MPFDAGLCPTVSGTLSTVPTASCVNTLDQTQKIALQIIQSTASLKLATSGTGSFALQATWTPLLSSATATKVILTPYIEGLVIPQNEAQEDANENNINGLPQHLGYGFVKVTGKIKNADPAVIAALKANTESQSGQTAGITSIWAYFLGRNSRVTGVKNATELAGIPIYNLTITDVGSEGLKKSNYHNISFVLPEAWSKDLTTLVAAFDPMTLANA